MQGFAAQRISEVMDHPLPYSAVLRLDGPDAASLLERTVTCDVAGLGPEAERPGALLTPQGKVIADFLLRREGETCRLAASPLAIEALEARLRMMRLRAKVEISRGEDRPDAASEAERIAAVRPAFGKDFGAAEVFPSDVNLDLFGGVAWRKGCFIGQEVVSRMKRRGTIRKRTIVLEGIGLAAGNAVLAGGVRIGDVTSAADDLALARVRIDHLAKAGAEPELVTGDGAFVKVRLEDWLVKEMEAMQDAAD